MQQTQSWSKQGLLGRANSTAVYFEAASSWQRVTQNSCPQDFLVKFVSRGRRSPDFGIFRCSKCGTSFFISYAWECASRSFQSAPMLPEHFPHSGTRHKRRQEQTDQKRIKKAGTCRHNIKLILDVRYYKHFGNQIRPAHQKRVSRLFWLARSTLVWTYSCMKMFR